MLFIVQTRQIVVKHTAQQLGLKQVHFYDNEVEYFDLVGRVAQTQIHYFKVILPR